MRERVIYCNRALTGRIVNFCLFGGILVTDINFPVCRVLPGKTLPILKPLPSTLAYYTVVISSKMVAFVGSLPNSLRVISLFTKVALGNRNVP